MHNRRNYYRILRVQPDASVEVIKDSYRALMQKLRMHPDLGGEDWNASVINQAYATLRNPAKRATYDEELLREHDIATLSRGHLKIPPSMAEQAEKTASSSDNNQRNYYRILHVQPDAEPAVIAASYQVLKKQGITPDALLDKAWTVLSDKKKRAAYDKTLQEDPSVDDSEAKIPITVHSTGTLSPITKSRLAGAYGQAQSGAYKAVITRYCLFCKTPYERNQLIEDAQRCSVCESPLFSPPSALQDQPRRALARIQQTGVIMFYEYWPGQRYNGTLLDLSPTGLRFASLQQMELGQVIKIDGNGFAAVAEITSCQRTADAIHTGVRFTTVSFDRQSGSFVSTSA